MRKKREDCQRFKFKSLREKKEEWKWYLSGGSSGDLLLQVLRKVLNIEVELAVLATDPIGILVAPPQELNKVWMLQGLSGLEDGKELLEAVVIVEILGE